MWGLSNRETRVIDDLIILGRAIPEEISDHRQTICAAGYSDELGLVRLYPTRWDSPLKRWNIVNVPVERPRKPLYDGRAESWKIQGSRSEWDKLSEKIDHIGTLRKKTDRICLVEKLIFPCASQLNSKNKSLGIIKPEIIDYFFIENPRKKKVRLQTLDGSFRLMVKDDFDYFPKIKYRCSECRAKIPHNQQLLEWGFYEGMRKNPGDIDSIWDNVGFSDQDNWDFYFLVGDLWQFPGSFNVISILRFKK